MTSSLGPMALVANDTALVGVWFNAQKHFPLQRNWVRNVRHPVLQQTMQQLDEYFAGRRTVFDLPLDLSAGTVFQQRVWRALLDIAHGVTVTYGTISERIGQPSAVRAVGGAIGRNPIGIIVPCHRVLGANGGLTGYAGGLERKTALLQLEKIL